MLTTLFTFPVPLQFGQVLKVTPGAVTNLFTLIFLLTPFAISFISNFNFILRFVPLFLCCLPPPPKKLSKGLPPPKISPN